MPYLMSLTWKASGLFHCSRKDFNLTAHLVQSIVLALAQYLTTFITHPGRTTRKARLQYTFHWNNWWKLKAHSWKINQHIPDSFSLEALLKRDFSLCCLKYMRFRSLCFSEPVIHHLTANKNICLFPAKQDEQNPGTAEISGTLFSVEGAESHFLYSSWQKFSGGNTWFVKLGTTQHEQPAPVLHFVRCFIQITVMFSAVEIVEVKLPFLCADSCTCALVARRGWAGLAELRCSLHGDGGCDQGTFTLLIESCWRNWVSKDGEGA